MHCPIIRFHIEVLYWLAISFQLSAYPIILPKLPGNDSYIPPLHILGTAWLRYMHLSTYTVWIDPARLELSDSWGIIIIIITEQWRKCGRGYLLYSIFMEQLTPTYVCMRAPSHAFTRWRGAHHPNVNVTCMLCVIQKAWITRISTSVSFKLQAQKNKLLSRFPL